MVKLFMFWYFTVKWLLFNLSLPKSTLNINLFFLVHTNSISKVCVFVFIQTASIDSRPHYRFGAFSTVRTETFENKRLARLETYVELYAHAANTRAYDIFGHRFHFEAFSNVFDRPHL